MASRCNLNCSYCYVYNAGDLTYREQPAVMSAQTVEKTIERAAEHCAEHGLTRFTFVFHGGEPLLAGRSFFASFGEKANELLGRGVRPRFAVQTNGTLLDDAWCALFNEHDMLVGISIDGPPDAHDRYRVDHAGNGSYQRVRTGIERAVKRLDRTPGLLTVVNVQSDPDEVWDHLVGLGVSAVDFLLPDATHASPPDIHGRTEYGEWLIRVFDRWYGSNRRPRVRLFEDIVRSILGYRAVGHGTGGSQSGILVVETNGDIEAIDYLKVCYPGATKIGASVDTHTLSEAMDHPLIAAYYDAAGHACETCRSCPIFGVCGGGDLVHRWDRSNGFDNPTVYCADRMKLIVHIQKRVVGDLPRSVVIRHDVRPFTLEEIRGSINHPVNAPTLVDDEPIPGGVSSRPDRRATNAQNS